MALTIQQKEYPICDSDIWIKVCQLEKLELIFDKYDITFISDAVVQELHKKKNDAPEVFGHCLEKCQASGKAGKVIFIKLSDRNFFDEKLKNDVLRQFSQHNIVYDEKECRFVTNRKNLGEMVSAIYASIHGLTLILSDDKGSDSFVDTNYRYLQVIKLKDLLLYYGLSDKEIQNLILDANSKCNIGTSGLNKDITNKSFRALKKSIKRA